MRSEAHNQSFLSKTSASAATTSSASSPSSITRPAPAAAPASHILFLPPLRFWSIVNEQGIKWQRIRQHEIPDIVSTDRQAVQWCWFAVSRRHFHGLEMRVHLHVNACLDGYKIRWGTVRSLRRRVQAKKKRTCDCPMNNGPIFELDRHRLIVQLHQKSGSKRRTHRQHRNQQMNKSGKIRDMSLVPSHFLKIVGIHTLQASWCAIFSGVWIRREVRLRFTVWPRRCLGRKFFPEFSISIQIPTVWCCLATNFLQHSFMYYYSRGDFP